MDGLAGRLLLNLVPADLPPRNYTQAKDLGFVSTVPKALAEAAVYPGITGDVVLLAGTQGMRLLAKTVNTGHKVEGLPITIYRWLGAGVNLHHARIIRLRLICQVWRGEDGYHFIRLTVDLNGYVHWYLLAPGCRLLGKARLYLKADGTLVITDHRRQLAGDRSDHTCLNVAGAELGDLHFYWHVHLEGTP